ncbi:PGF-CTERM sorting domain-containing protein [Haloferax sp. DFSO60]|uniref:PGF-CTERM sorting domain-containing protein n=1 Tax=Haloferax sp. DFSO60 TaxID=3388652 RepID=UPI00397C212E
MVHRKTAAFAGLALLLLLAGCAQVTVHSTVNGDGSIAEQTYQINMTRTAYGYLEEAAEEEGYESVEDSILSDLNETEREQIEYSEEYNGDTVTMTLTRTDFIPTADDGISVTTEDGELVYEDMNFVDEAAAAETETDFSQSITSGMSVDYYLTMPGEITDSNADVVDGNTAEWHESGSEAFNDNRIYARSEKPTFSMAPGFGPVSALVALLAVALVVLRRD